MAISSIHIEAGSGGYFAHNSRESKTVNSIFDDEQNYCSSSKEEAFKLFREELNTRTQAYEKRTGQKLQKNATTHLSAIFNFNYETTPEQAHKVCEYLEKTLDTKVVQMSMHRDEGHIIEEESKAIHDKIKINTAIKNYHGHIEMLGLDSQGNSIRRKLDKPMLREIQTEVAKILQMERGRQTSYNKEEYLKITSELKPQNEYADKKEYNKAFNEKAKELGLYKEKKAKRLDTYEYKHLAETVALKVKEKNEVLKIAKKENSSLKGQNTKLKKSNEALKTEVSEVNSQCESLKFDKKELEKQLKELNNLFRDDLKESGATREQYAELEALTKQLKEELKNKTLTMKSMQSKYAELEEKLLKQESHLESIIEVKEIDIEELQNQNKLLIRQKEVLTTKVTTLEEKINSRASIVSQKEIVNELQTIIKDELQTKELFESRLSKSSTPVIVIKDAKSFSKRIQELATQGVQSVVNSINSFKKELEEWKDKYNKLADVLKSKDRRIAELEDKLQDISTKQQKENKDTLSELVEKHEAQTEERTSKSTKKKR